MGTKEHKKAAPAHLRIGVVSVSSSRTLETDKSGQWIAGRTQREGHTLVYRRVVPDERQSITRVMFGCIHHHDPHALIFTGGTGVAEKDVTIEAVTPYFKKALSAFAVLFAQLSFETVDSAAIMSRAAAGIVGKSAVFCIPGSLKACKLACEALIFPELGHIVKHVRMD